MRDMRANDLEPAMALAGSRGWTVFEPEWELLLSLGRGFVVTDEHGLVATITAITRGDVCVLGMLLVREDHERRGIGTAMMRHAIASVPARTYALVATSMGEPVYQRLGFRPVSPIVQMRADHVTDAGPASAARAAKEHDLALMSALDGQAKGWSRSDVLARVVAMSNCTLVAGPGNDRLDGFAAIRDYGAGSLVGPIVARGDAVAIDLLASACATASGPVTLQLDAQHEALVQWSIDRGFRATGSLTWMLHGPTPAGLPVYRYAPISGALG